MEPQDDEDDILVEIEELDDKQAQKLALSVSITNHDDLGEVALAAIEHGDVIDQLFDDMLLPDAPAPLVETSSDGNTPYKNPNVDEETIHLSDEDEDILFFDEGVPVEEDEELPLEEESDLAEEAFYKQFEEKP